MRYALVGPQDQIKYIKSNVSPDVGTKPGWRWLPCPEVARPTFDQTAEVVEGPTYTVNASDVTEVWTKRNQTAQEISDQKDEQISTSVNGSGWKIMAIVLLNHENRIRAREGKAAITMAQFKAGVKALL